MTPWWITSINWSNQNDNFGLGNTVFCKHLPIIIIDRNGLQITGKTEDVNPLEPLNDKLKAFGFKVHEINGNDVIEINDTINQISLNKEKNILIANTCKGKGVSFMENIVSWHHKVPTNDEFSLAISELENQKKMLINE